MQPARGTSFLFLPLFMWMETKKPKELLRSKIRPLELGTDKLQVQKLLQGRGRHLPKFCIARFGHFYRLEIRD